MVQSLEVSRVVAQTELGHARETDQSGPSGRVAIQIFLTSICTEFGEQPRVRELGSYERLC